MSTEGRVAKCAARLVICACFVATCSIRADTNRPKELSVEDHLRRFAVGSSQERASSEVRLYTLGKEALPGLDKLSQSSDPNLVERARELRDAIVTRIQRPPHVESADFSSDGRLVAVSSLSEGVRCHVWVTDVVKGADLVHFRGTPTMVGRVNFSPDGRHLLVTGFRPALEADPEGHTWIGIWDWRTGELARKLLGHTDSVCRARVSADGKFVISCGFDGTVRLWDFSTGREQCELIKQDSRILDAAFAGSRCLAVGEDAILRVWDLATRRQTASFQLPRRGYELAVSANDRFVAVAVGTMATVGNKRVNIDGGIHVYDLASNSLARHLSYESDAVQSHALSEDGAYLLTGDLRHKVTLWRVKDGAELDTHLVQRDRVSRVAFTERGKQILAIDGFARVYSWPLSIK